MTIKWGSAYEQYARRWVRSNQWRVINTIGGAEDCLQECALVFVKVSNRYPNANNAQFMALYKVSLINHWATLSTKDHLSNWRYSHLKFNNLKTATQVVNEFREQDTDTACAPEVNSPEPTTYPDASLAVAYGEASAEVREFFRLLNNAPADFLQLVFAIDDDASINRFIQRILRLGADRNVVSELRCLLSES